MCDPLKRCSWEGLQRIHARASDGTVGWVTLSGSPGPGAAATKDEGVYASIHNKYKYLYIMKLNIYDTSYIHAYMLGCLDNGDVTFLELKRFGSLRGDGPYLVRKTPS